SARIFEGHFSVRMTHPNADQNWAELSLTRQDGDGAGPARRGAMYLDREADHLEAVGREHFEIVQLLEMRMADLAAGAMAFPDQADVAGLLHFAASVGERRVPAPAVGADQAHAALKQPQRRRLAHAAAAVDIVVLAVARAGAGIDQHDLERPDAVADPLELALDVAGRRDIAVGQMAEIELYRRVEAPLQGHLVDPP